MSPGPEIQSYFRQVATNAASVRTSGSAPRSRRRDTGTGSGGCGTADGEEVFDVLITATGVLRVPRYPTSRGSTASRGRRFTPSRWDHSVSLPDKRIGIDRHGLDRRADHRGARRKVRGLKIFQRTPQWVFPTPNLRYSRTHQGGAAAVARPEHGRLSLLASRYIENAFGRATVEPGWQRRLVSAMCRWNLQFSVRDPELRRRLTPDYQAMCKRRCSLGTTTKSCRSRVSNSSRRNRPRRAERRRHRRRYAARTRCARAGNRVRRPCLRSPDEDRR